MSRRRTALAAALGVCLSAAGGATAKRSPGLIATRDDGSLPPRCACTR